MNNVTLKEYINFKNNYVSIFFPKNLDTWSNRILLESINDKKLMQEIEKYIDLCTNDISAKELNELLDYLHKKIIISIEKVKKSYPNDKFKEMSKTMIYVGMFESIDELSSFCDNLITSIKNKYGEDYLKIIQMIDKSHLSIDGKKVLIELNNVQIEDDLLNKYLVLKKWQDINHNFYYKSIEPLLKEVEETYISENENTKFNYESVLALQKLNELNNKTIINLDDLTKYYLAGLDKELIKIVGGKAYGLAILKSLGIDIPTTFIIPISSKLHSFKEFFDANKKYSVRSSADVEDGEKNSFAGMFDSYLDVDIKDLDNSINNVKNSVKNVRVKKYIEHYNLNFPNMAVIIQEFIEPEFAGVWIGKDLNSGVLEYTSGNGEKLVSGKITPNREVWGTIDATNYNINCSSGAIGQLLLKIQNKIGTISDFEWMILNNKLYLLQYRPVTSKIIIEDSAMKINNEECFKGIPASPGCVSGSARFINVRHIDKVNDWKKGDILMAWFTDPEWMNILANSSGIVTAVGGFLCHSAIIARELGIPCVIGIGEENMKKIWNEKELTIDGDNGLVYKTKKYIKSNNE